MGRYSHSKISTFEQCKYKYKLVYIDMIRSDVQSIESFMGSLVHQTLEKLYNDVVHGTITEKEDLLRFYLLTWSREWNSKITIVKKEFDAEYYQNLGLTFILEYYDAYYPFNQLETLGIETDERLKLADHNEYYIKIDRLAKDNAENYYVIDYKTSNGLKKQEELDKDRQLAMYSLWVKEKYPDAKSVKLVWNFLAFNEEKTSVRSDEELVRLKEEVEKTIQEIEVCNDFPTQVSKLCNYCEYKAICPAWKDSTPGDRMRYYKQTSLQKFID
jgi:putative RecB family exonuclease